MSLDFFSKTKGSNADAPLSERMRPESLSEVVGQTHLLGEGKILSKIAVSKQILPSLIFCGPPGVGKTTIARVLAKSWNAHLVGLSAVHTSVKDLKEIFENARSRTTSKTVLFLDEIHRFNKAQQDHLLGGLERGELTLIGATTENPSFALNKALLSRTRIITLRPIGPNDVVEFLKLALKNSERGLGKQNQEIEPDALEWIAQMAQGDMRAALGLLELSSSLTNNDAIIEKATVVEAAKQTRLSHDKSGDDHYNLLSAFHKSLRHSDVEATLYYMSRLLEAGEDPVTIARRMIRVASEDIGLADIQALPQALAALEACRHIGLPECDLALAQAAVYLATCPKSNSLYLALQQTKAFISETGAIPIPLIYRNAVSSYMRDEGFGSGYQYDHDFHLHIGSQEALPAEVIQKRNGKPFFVPNELGYEKEVRRRMDFIKSIRTGK